MNPSNDGYIHINSEWCLQADQVCVTLFRKRVAGPKAKNAGQLQYDPVGYYPGYEQALSAMVDRDIQPLNSIDYVVDRLVQLKKDIAIMCKSISEAPQDRRESTKGEN